MFDYAARGVGRKTNIVERILSGVDVHQATADLLGDAGVEISRHDAKQGNFAELYGASVKTLALTLKCSVDAAQKVKDAIDRGSPEIARFTGRVRKAARRRGYIENWLGRRSHFPYGYGLHKAPNYLIQGGCADVVKICMNLIDDALKGMKSKMVLQIHDELVLQVHLSEINTVPKLVQEIMESVYPYTYLPLTCGMEWSDKSLADKIKGFPTL